MIKIKILKDYVSGKKTHTTCRKMIKYCRLPIRNNSSPRTLENIFKALKVNIIQSVILYPAKRSLEDKGQIRHFQTDKS